MNQLRSRVRLRHLALGLALCAVAWAGAACAPTTVTPAATTAPTVAATLTSAPAAAAADMAAIGSDKAYSQDPAPSIAVSPAAGKVRHFMGDPNASVVLVEISDFQ